MGLLENPRSTWDRGWESVPPGCCHPHHPKNRAQDLTAAKLEAGTSPGPSLHLGLGRACGHSPLAWWCPLCSPSRDPTGHILTQQSPLGKGQPLGLEQIPIRLTLISCRRGGAGMPASKCPVSAAGWGPKMNPEQELNDGCSWGWDGDTAGTAHTLP